MLSLQWYAYRLEYSVEWTFFGKGLFAEPASKRYLLYFTERWNYNSPIEMKNLLKLESLALLLASIGVYFHFFPGNWIRFISLFFAPDLAFVFLLISRKWTVFAYNFLHHQGLCLILLGMGYLLKMDLWIQVGLIFFAHSAFDRIWGYGLKYPDQLDRTHLGWIGKQAWRNAPESNAVGGEAHDR
ncbi:DUF4260 family protein [bacterium]|nr:DUF4260 family protein [bacterium]